MSFPFPVSPSQINTARLCWRRYGLEYIDGLESEPNQYAALGTEMHGHKEAWFKEGKLPPKNTQAGQMARAGLHMWPAPARVDEVEVHIEVATEHAYYHGYQDIGYWDTIKHGGKKLRLRVVGDHKSCGDHKWAKKPHELARDPQAVIYSAAAMERYKVDTVLTKWVYTTRGRKPKVKKVLRLMTRADVEQAFDEIDDTARDIYYVRGTPGITGMDLPPNPHACSAFGGCPHVEVCNLSPKERMKAYMAQMTLREKILANKAAKKAGQSVEKPAGKPTVAAGKKDNKPAAAKEPANGKLSAAERLKQLKLKKKAEEAEEEAEEEASDDEADEEDVEETEADEDATEADEDEAEEAPPPKKVKPSLAAKSKPASNGNGHGAPKQYVAKLVDEKSGVFTYSIPELNHTFKVGATFGVVG